MFEVLGVRRDGGLLTYLTQGEAESICPGPRMESHATHKSPQRIAHLTQAYIPPQHIAHLSQTHIRSRLSGAYCPSAPAGASCREMGSAAAPPPAPAAGRRRPASRRRVPDHAVIEIVIFVSDMANFMKF